MKLTQSAGRVFFPPVIEDLRGLWNLETGCIMHPLIRISVVGPWYKYIFNIPCFCSEIFTCLLSSYLADDLFINFSSSSTNCLNEIHERIESRKIRFGKERQDERSADQMFTNVALALQTPSSVQARTFRDKRLIKIADRKLAR